MTWDQYNIRLSVFYIPYVLFAFPVGLLGKKYGPVNVLPIMMISFGAVTLLAASVQNFGGMMALRWFLGIAESAFFPVTIYYLVYFHRRAELARRLAIFYAASNIANAFSGLLAFGVFQIQAGTSLAVPRVAKFLNTEEKALAFKRIRTDPSAIVGEKLVIKDAIKGFKPPQLGVEGRTSTPKFPLVPLK